MEIWSVVLTFVSVDEILWCDHSNETSSSVLLQGTICFLIFYKIKIWDFSSNLIFGTLGSYRVKYEFVLFFLNELTIIFINSFGSVANYYVSEPRVALLSQDIFSKKVGLQK